MYVDGHVLDRPSDTVVAIGGITAAAAIVARRGPRAWPGLSGCAIVSRDMPAGRSLTEQAGEERQCTEQQPANELGEDARQVDYTADDSDHRLPGQRRSAGLRRGDAEGGRLLGRDPGGPGQASQALWDRVATIASVSARPIRSGSIKMWAPPTSIVPRPMARSVMST